MKTLIVYYSNTGNNELLALHLHKKLQCEILKIQELNRRSGFTIFFDILFNRTPKLKKHNLRLEQYDEFIFVGPVWAGRIASPIRAFMRDEKRFIKSYSLITFCGGGAKEQADKIRNELKNILAIAPTAVVELWITRLPVKAAITSNYHATAEDLKYFEKQIEEFLEAQPTLVAGR